MSKPLNSALHPDAFVATPLKRPLLRVAMVCAAALLFIAGTRFALLVLYSGSVPFWDQWDAENQLLLSFQDGSLSLTQLVAPHNEHRIFWTRLLGLALFVLNGRQWDNTLEAIAANSIYCLALLIPIFAVLRNLPLKAALSCTLIAAMGGVLPFAWENTLVGFQSQFYIGLFFSLAAFYIAATASTRFSTALILIFLSVAAYLSMASGVFAIVSVCGVLLFRGTVDKSLSPVFAVALAAVCMAIALTGISMTPHIEGHMALKAQSVIELAKAFTLSLSWPLPAPALVITWLPIAVWMIGAVCKRSAQPVDRFFAGMALFGALQALAMAYSRGHVIAVIPSRYTDGLFLMVLANAYFALKFVHFAKSRQLQSILGYLPLTALMFGLLYEGYCQVPMLLNRAYLSSHQTINVARYLGGDTNALLDKPPQHIPYPDAKILIDRLANPHTRGYLPATLLGYAPSRIGPQEPEGCAATASVSTTPSAIACSGDIAQQAVSPDNTFMAGPLSASIMNARRHLHWRGFPVARATANLQVGSQGCAIDSINDVSKDGDVVQMAYSDAILRLAGWTTPARSGLYQLRTDPLKIAFRGEHADYLATLGLRRILRTDVATATTSKHYAWSGFEAFIDISDLPRGKYLILTSSGSAPFCESGDSIFVEPSNVPFARL